MDPLLISLMQQAAKQLELKSSLTFIAIKHCQGTKIERL